MPLIKSAIKRVRQNAAARERLLPWKTHMKTMVRKVLDLAREGKKEAVAKMLPLVYKSIDTAAKKNIIHRKTAARKKSRVAKLVKQ